MSVLVNKVRGALPGSRLIARNPEGLIVGRGVVRDDLRCGMAVWGDDLNTIEREGCLAGESFKLSLIQDDGCEQEVSVVEFLAGDELRYAENRIAVVNAAVVEPVPVEFELLQVYPNPFNSVVRVRFAVTNPGIVSLTIFDIDGRRVYENVDKNAREGRNERVIDAGHLATGVYFLNLEVGGNSIREKVVLIR